MEISITAKERFCKDCNIPLRLFQEPYFTDRLKLYDKFYGTLKKWDLFVKELGKYRCEQDYFGEYNRVKDNAIAFVQNTEAFQRFNAEDMNKYHVVHENLPVKDIFKASNAGKDFLSIDMKKANFSSLKHYDAAIFRGAGTWEEFIGEYTDNRHMIESKYIRQVILGNCNAKKHITYEKYLMDTVLSHIEKYDISHWKIAFFSNDEIIFDVTGMKDLKEILHSCRFLESDIAKHLDIPVRVQYFQLQKIEGTDGYCKEAINTKDEVEIEFKCLNNYVLPFVIRKYLGEEIVDSDRVFYHEGLLAQFIEVPQIEVKGF